MNSEMTAGPWVTLIGEPVEESDGGHSCQIGLVLTVCPSGDGEPLMLGYRLQTGESSPPQPGYLKMTGICRPADAVAMGAAGDLLQAAQQAIYLLESHGIQHPSIDAVIRAAITKATTLPEIQTLPAVEGGAA
jgi:hypothetical protein